MWGNALGWCLSALMTLAVCAFVWWLGLAGEVTSSRTSFSEQGDVAAAIQLPVPVSAVLPGMADAADAGPIYRRAIAEYLKSPQIYEQFARSGRERDIQDVAPGIQILAEATKCGSSKLFSDTAAEIVNFNNEKPPLDALRTLGTCARRAGQLVEKQRPDEAMRLYEAAFSLGAKLYQERLTYAELDVGLTLMAEGSKLIQLLSAARGDTPRADAARRFDDGRIAYFNQRLMPVQQVMSTADQAALERHCGDVMHFARFAAERMWRVEAIFKVGRYRFNAPRSADQRAANRLLQDLAENDPDPIIRTAAIAARDLTTEQYRMLR